MRVISSQWAWPGTERPTNFRLLLLSFHHCVAAFPFSSRGSRRCLWHAAGTQKDLTYKSSKASRLSIGHVEGKLTKQDAGWGVGWGVNTQLF